MTGCLESGKKEISEIPYNITYKSVVIIASLNRVFLSREAIIGNMVSR